MKIMYLIVAVGFLKFCGLSYQDGAVTEKDSHMKNLINIRVGNDYNSLENQHSANRKYKQLLKSNGRIVGGYFAKIEDYPFVAGLFKIVNNNKKFLGGATIISLRWVLTAAHCTDRDVEGKRAFVFSNSAELYKYPIQHRIVKIYNHEEYDLEFADNDIAAIKVKEPFSGANEKPIAFVKSNYVYEDNTSATILGWGFTRENEAESKPHALLYVNLTLTNFEYCQNIYKSLGDTLTERMVCAYTSGKDSCSGDSGGPLYQNNKLIGIISWGMGCARPNVPGVYTRVSKFQRWIESKVCKKNRKLARTRSISIQQIRLLEDQGGNFTL